MDKDNLETPQEETKPVKQNIIKEIFLWALTITAALLIAGIINTHLFAFVKVDGPSMQNTMFTDQKLFLYKFSQVYSPIPKRKDIVVVNIVAGKNYLIPFLKSDEKDYIKRVIGLPGEKVEIRDGSVFINDEILDEPYAIGPTYINNSPTLTYSQVIPKNHIFILGDNRPRSQDSRSSSVGFIEIEKIKGKALFRVLPIKEFGFLN